MVGRAEPELVGRADYGIKLVDAVMDVQWQRAGIVGGGLCQPFSDSVPCVSVWYANVYGIDEF